MNILKKILNSGADLQSRTESNENRKERRQAGNNLVCVQYTKSDKILFVITKE